GPTIHAVGDLLGRSLVMIDCPFEKPLHLIMTGDALQVQSQKNPAGRNGDLITGILMRYLVAAGVVDMETRQKIGWSREPVRKRGGREHLLYKTVIRHVQPQVHPNVVVE